MKDKSILTILFFIWVISDIITTTFGFYIGMKEKNPILSSFNLTEIIIIKFIAFFIFVYYTQSIRITKYSKWRYIPYLTMFIMGIIIIVLNTYGIVNYLNY